MLAPLPLLLVATVLAPPESVLPTPVLLKGPTWISIELPANPWNREARGAFLLVRALHHSTPAAASVTGVAEGLVDGTRRSVNLRLQPLRETGVYAAHDQWGAKGEWLLVFTVEESDHGFAQAMVRVSNGEVTSVRVPTTTNRSGDLIPRRITAREIEQALRQ